MISRTATIASVALAVVAATATVEADVPTVAPIVVSIVGQEPVRVVVAEGNVAPCDASENHALYRGIVDPGHPVVLQTTGACICVQQTFAPMRDTDWGPAAFACRPMDCRYGYRGTRVCTPAADPTIRVALSSRR